MPHDEPAAEREYPYMQLAAKLRRQILDGTLAPGQKLPPQRELAQAEGVSVTTVGRALNQLQVERRIRTSSKGSFVDDGPTLASSGHDRITRALRTGSLLAEGETVTVTAAQLVVPPLYVREIFDLDDGDQVVRRQWHTGRGDQRTMLAVTWYPAAFAASVPDLLSTAPSKARGLLRQIIEATGRCPADGRDDMHGREADQREASFLGLKTGAAILAGAHRLWDDEGVIEYGEWCLPPLAVIGYEYSLAPDAFTTDSP